MTSALSAANPSDGGSASDSITIEHEHESSFELLFSYLDLASNLGLQPALRHFGVTFPA